MNELTCYYNGRFLPLQETGVPVTDLIVQRGYGIFDFLRISQHVPLFCMDHLDRFFRSANEMRLPLQQTKAEIMSVIMQLIEKNALADSGMRILLTGGESPDGYQVIQPGLVMIQQAMAAPPDQIMEQGYKLATYGHQRQLPHVKTTDYLMAIWLQPWMKDQGADDILYTADGVVSECPRSNFFLVTDAGTIVTPGRNILKGITRKHVLDIAINHGLQVEERDITMDDIIHAREAFITSSTKRIIPVMGINDISYSRFIPASVTGQLYDLLLQKEKEFLRSSA